MIFKANSDVVSWTQTMLKEQLAQTIGGLVKLLVGDYLCRRSHDDGWLVWSDGCYLSWKHSQKLAQFSWRQAIYMGYQQDQ
jgi:hypothetical protein